MPPRDRTPATRARTLDLASQLLASDLTHEAVGPYLHRLMQPLGIDERVTKAALRLTGRARPKPLRPDLEPATAALRGLEPVHRASYLLAAAERLQEGLDTPGVGYTGALATEGRYLAQHRAAVEGRDRAAARVDDVASRHGLVLRWVARKDAHPGCRKMHGRLFRADDPPVVEGRPAFPGAVHPACKCVAAPRLGDRAGVAVASLSGRAVELAYNPAQLRNPGGEGGGRWVKVGQVPKTTAETRLTALCYHPCYRSTRAKGNAR